MEQCNWSWPPCSHPETWIRQQVPTAAMLSSFRAEGFSPVSDTSSDEEPPDSEDEQQMMDDLSNDISNDAGREISEDISEDILRDSNMDVSRRQQRASPSVSTPGAANLVARVVTVAMASAIPGADGASVSPTALTMNLLAPSDSLMLGVCVGGIAAAVAIAIISSSTVRSWVSDSWCTIATLYRRYRTGDHLPARTEDHLYFCCAPPGA